MVVKIWLLIPVLILFGFKVLWRWWWWLKIALRRWHTSGIPTTLRGRGRQFVASYGSGRTSTDHRNAIIKSWRNPVILGNVIAGRSGIVVHLAVVPIGLVPFLGFANLLLPNASISPGVDAGGIFDEPHP
jgi:hypothetical protein